MPWRYGIVRYKTEGIHKFYGVGELFFDKDPLKPHSCTQEPVDVYCEDEDFSDEEFIKDEVKNSLERMMKDCMKYPIFDIEGPYEKHPWDSKRSVDSLTNDQINAIVNNQMDEFLKDHE